MGAAREITRELLPADRSREHEEEVWDESRRTLLSCTENGVLDGEIREVTVTPIC
jgi:hypothetical protein